MYTFKLICVHAHCVYLRIHMYVLISEYTYIYTYKRICVHAHCMYLRIHIYAHYTHIHIGFHTYESYFTRRPGTNRTKLLLPLKLSIF